MFSKVSTTGAGMLVFTVTSFLGFFDVMVDTEQIAGFVNALAQVIGFLVMVYGQLARKDLIAGIVRK